MLLPHYLFNHTVHPHTKAMSDSVIQYRVYVLNYNPLFWYLDNIVYDQRVANIYKKTTQYSFKTNRNLYIKASHHGSKQL